MTEQNATNHTIVRTGRGLTIAGTRITLYDIMDYLKADWPPRLIQHWLSLSETQISDVLAYIRDHQTEVEAEYQRLQQQAEEIRAYWDERNRDRLAYIASLPPPPGQEELYAKIQASKAALGMK